MTNRLQCGAGPLVIAAVIAMLLTVVPTSPILAEGPHQPLPDGRLSQGAFLLSSNVEGTITISVDVFNDGNGTATGYKLAVYEGTTGPSLLIGR